MRTTRKIAEEILKNQLELKESLAPKVGEKARKYDEVCETVRNVRLKVKNIHSYVDEHGRNAITVTYEPVVETIIVADEVVMSTERFKAINELNLIPFSDMRRISAEIERLKKVK